MKTLSIWWINSNLITLFWRYPSIYQVIHEKLRLHSCLTDSSNQSTHSFYSTFAVLILLIHLHPSGISAKTAVDVNKARQSLANSSRTPRTNYCGSYELTIFVSVVSVIAWNWQLTKDISVNSGHSSAIVFGAFAQTSWTHRSRFALHCSATWTAPSSSMASPESLAAFFLPWLRWWRKNRISAKERVIREFEAIELEHCWCHSNSGRQSSLLTQNFFKKGPISMAQYCL